MRLAYLVTFATMYVESIPWTPHILIFLNLKIFFVLSCPEIIIPGIESAQAATTPVIGFKLPAPAVTKVADIFPEAL